MRTRTLVRNRSTSRASLAAHANALTRKQRAAFLIGPQTRGPIGHVFGTATTAQAMKLVADTLSAPRPFAEKANETRELVNWASVSGTLAQRRTMVKAFRESKADVLLIHHISRLEKESMSSFIKDYFAAGGQLKPIVDWLRMMGRVAGRPGTSKRKSKLSRRKVTVRKSKASSRDLWDDFTGWVGGVGEEIFDTIGDFVDALVSAGKTLAQVVSEVASWSVEELTELTRALLKADQLVGDILTAAARKGLDLLGKFVEATLNIPGKLHQITTWASRQTLSWATSVVRKLLQLGNTVLQILTPVLDYMPGASLIIKSILAAGKTLNDLVNVMVGQSLAFAEFISRALLAAGQTLRSMLVEVAKLSLSARHLIIQGLLHIGKTVAEILSHVALGVSAALRATLSTLLEIGFSLADIVSGIVAASMRFGSVAIEAGIGALLSMGKTATQIVAAALTRTIPILRSTFRALLALGQKVKDLLGAVAGRALSALRMALEALFTMGMALPSIVTEIVTGVAERFRRGFFEGLIALGFAPLQLLKAAAEVSASVVLLAFTVVVELFGGHRSLSRAEHLQVQNVFGSSIDMARVKIAVASLPSDILNYINDERPFTTMYIINFASGAEVDMRTIIHELTHVWQGVQKGPLYMVQALEAQIGAGVNSLYHTGIYDDDAAYDVTNAALEANRGDFGKFNPEQQAKIIELYWVQKFSGAPIRFPYLRLLEPYARSVFKPLSVRTKVAGRAKTVARKRVPKRRIRSVEAWT